MDLYKLTATELAIAIRTQQTTAVDAIAACFDQLNRHNPQFNAFITLCREQGHWFRWIRKAECFHKYGLEGITN